MTTAAQPTDMDWAMDDAAMHEDHSSPTDSSMFKAIFIPLYCTVFGLCFAGQLLHIPYIAALLTRPKAAH